MLLFPLLAGSTPASGGTATQPDQLKPCTHPSRAQERNQAKQAAAGKGSQLKTNQAAQSIVCQVCRGTFLCTSSHAKLVEHADSKHPGKGGQYSLLLCSMRTGRDETH